MFSWWPQLTTTPSSRQAAGGIQKRARRGHGPGQIEQEDLRTPKLDSHDSFCVNLRVRVIERFFSGVPHPHLLGVCHPDIVQKQLCRFIPIRLAHPSFEHRIVLLTEHSLPGVRLPPNGSFLLLLFPALQCRSRIGGPETNVNRVQKEQSNDIIHAQNSASLCPQAESLEINAGCRCQGCHAQPVKGGESGPVAGSNWSKGLRDLVVAGTGTGPRPGALVRGRTAVAAGLKAGGGKSEFAVRIAVSQPKGESKPNAAVGNWNPGVRPPPHDRADCGRRSHAGGVGGRCAVLL